jgi:hypothetical protein
VIYALPFDVTRRALRERSGGLSIAAPQNNLTIEKF